MSICLWGNCVFVCESQSWNVWWRQCTISHLFSCSIALELHLIINIQLSQKYWTLMHDFCTFKPGLGLQILWGHCINLINQVRTSQVHSVEETNNHSNRDILIYFFFTNWANHIFQSCPSLKRMNLHLMRSERRKHDSTASNQTFLADSKLRFNIMDY